MRTIVYVDGMNLYYGCLKSTAYKWLDLQELSISMLRSNKIIGVKYFCAELQASGDDSHVKAQQSYFEALRTTGVEIYLGYFMIREGFKPEEKGTDVNLSVHLSVHLLNDAWHNRYDCAVLISNDNDMAEALRLVKEQWPEKRIQLLSPVKKKLPIAEKLESEADSIRRIRNKHLAFSQFPDIIPNTSISKPLIWYK